MKRTTRRRRRVRSLTVMMKKTMTVVAMAWMKKSRQPTPNCRLIGLLKPEGQGKIHRSMNKIDKI